LLLFVALFQFVWPAAVALSAALALAATMAEYVPA
jgi:hypothetical protein